MGLLEELKEYGYEIEETEDKNELTLYRSQYLDNGYGYYFYADITLTFDIAKDEVIDILVEDMTKEQIEEKLMNEINNCAIMNKYEECTYDNFVEGLTDIERDNQDCSNCIYYNMIDMLYESIDGGNW